MRFYDIFERCLGTLKYAYVIIHINIVMQNGLLGNIKHIKVIV